MRLALILGAGLLAGCMTRPAPDGPLTDLALWEAMGASEDPYGDRPSDAVCDPYGWGEEDGVLEVETGVCEYLTLRQPVLRDVHAGETIEVDIWNLGLWAERPAEGHASVELAGARWEVRPEIPSSGQAWVASIEVMEDLPAGTPIYLHVHNHGANSWRFSPPVSR